MSTEYIHGESGISCVYGKEATPGTEATTILNKLGLIQDITGIELGYEEKDTMSITSQAVQKTTAIRGKYNFTVTFIVQNWMFLFIAYGGYVNTFPSGAGPWTHKLEATNRLQSYTFELINDDRGISRKVLGCKLIEMKVSFVEGEEIKVEMSFTGRSTEKDPTPQTASELAIAPWFYDHVTIFSVDAVEKVDRALELTWVFTRGSEARRSIGSKEPRFIKEGKRKHLIECELYSDDLEIYDLVAGFTEFVTQIKCVTDAGNDELTLDFATCRTVLRQGDLPGDDVSKERFSIHPYAPFGTQVSVPTAIDSVIADFDI